ncbi:MAG: hypothetical protein LC114_21485 [Bryobacterales bacterium]|nr:hypothetical protein [Bryobacterales bacterium]
MPRKKADKMDVTKEVKRLARERIGTPPPARVEEEPKERKKEKHKKDWTEWETDT